MASITSTNVVFMLSINSLFQIPQQLQGFSVDDIFDTEAIDPAEIVMGADGKLSAGLIHVAIKQSFSLQADSQSNSLFEAWYAAQINAGDIYFSNATAYLPSISRAYVLRNGVLSSYPPLPDAKKILQPRKYSITWESVIGGPA